MLSYQLYFEQSCTAAKAFIEVRGRASGRGEREWEGGEGGRTDEVRGRESRRERRERGREEGRDGRGQREREWEGGEGREALILVALWAECQPSELESTGSYMYLCVRHIIAVHHVSS